MEFQIGIIADRSKWIKKDAAWAQEQAAKKAQALQSRAGHNADGVVIDAPLPPVSPWYVPCVSVACPTWCMVCGRCARAVTCPRCP